MGTYIAAVAQRKNSDGTFENIKKIFDFQSYDVFAWLAGVMNLAMITPLSQPRGIPQDILDKAKKRKLESDYFSDSSYEPPLINRILDEYCPISSVSWYSVEELLAVDYEQIILNRRNNGYLEPLPIDQAAPMKLKDFLDDCFMNELEALKQIKADRIVFGFY